VTPRNSKLASKLIGAKNPNLREERRVKEGVFLEESKNIYLLVDERLQTLSLQMKRRTIMERKQGL